MMAEVNTSVAKTPEESILSPGQGKIGGADLPSPAAIGQQGTMTPSATGGVEDVVPPEPAPEQVAQGRQLKMEEALIGSSISNDQRALADAFLESLRIMESRGETAFFGMLSGFEVCRNLVFPLVVGSIVASRAIWLLEHERP